MAMPVTWDAIALIITYHHVTVMFMHVWEARYQFELSAPGVQTQVSLTV